MKNIIQLLPEVVSNQIAAGEVVQRPSSVVKELLENSIDAGSTEIILNVANSGKTLIQVIDNGLGMSEIDSRLCFEKYATSKIRETEDLYNLKTMGFRGEAMASIGAVSQVTLRTNNEPDLVGTQIVVEGSKVISQTPINILKGTNIAVKNLFFNVPARRSFLKSDQVELKHILDEFIRIALSNSDVQFKMIHNEREIYNLPATKLNNRIIGLFKTSYKNQLLLCSDETAEIKIKGYIGKPEFAKKNRGEQFIFVNGRYIKSPYLHSSIMNAYDKIIKPGYIPFYVLFFDVNPSKIDVNIHPTKSEVDKDVAFQRMSINSDTNVFSKLGSETTVNTVTAGFQGSPDIDTLTTGEFVITWQSTFNNLAPTVFVIKARKYNATGSPLSAETLVSLSTSTFSRTCPVVAKLPNGKFIISWAEQNATGSDPYAVKAQIFDNDLSTIGPIFQVNTFTTGTSSFCPAIASEKSGFEFIIVWESMNPVPYKNNLNVFGNNYRLDDGSPTPLPTPSPTDSPTPPSISPTPAPTNNPVSDEDNEFTDLEFILIIAGSIALFFALLFFGLCIYFYVRNRD